MWCLERHVEVGVSGQPVNFLPRLLPRPKRPRAPREATVCARGDSSDTVTGVASPGLCGLSHSHLDCSRVRRGHGCRERPRFAREATVLTPSQALPLPGCVASPVLCGLSHSHLDCSRVRRGHARRERPLFAQEATVRARGHCSRERPLFAQEATVLTPSQALPLPCCVASPVLCGLSRVVWPLSTHPAGNRCRPGARSLLRDRRPGLLPSANPQRAQFPSMHLK